MPRDDPIVEEERRAHTATDLLRMRLERLQQNINKPAPIPARRAEIKPPRPPPEFVRNVVGSSAAAGSAEYHIYRINRKKEQNRLDYIAKVAETEELDEEYKKHREEIERIEAERTAKKRARRQRRKERAKRRKKVKKEEISGESSEDSDEEGSEEEEEALLDVASVKEICPTGEPCRAPSDEFNKLVEEIRAAIVFADTVLNDESSGSQLLLEASEKLEKKEPLLSRLSDIASARAKSGDPEDIDSLSSLTEELRNVRYAVEDRIVQCIAENDENNCEYRANNEKSGCLEQNKETLDQEDVKREEASS